MLKRCYSLIFIVFLLNGCAHHAQLAPKSKPMPMPQGGHSTQYRQVSSFSQIDVQGRLNINVHTGYKTPQVILTGDARDLAQVKTIMNYDTLYLSLGNGFPRYGEVNADIRGGTLNRIHYVGAGSIRGDRLYTNSLDLSVTNPQTTKLQGVIGLRNLDVNGSGSVQINGISSRYLEIHLKGDPKVQLTGFTNISKLDLDGPGWLSLYWVQSDRLVVTAKKASKIQLAGKVNKLEVELWGNATFKGRYLRAQRSFVKTHGRSVAEISSVHHQSTLSTDTSDIYYFNIPDTRADFMAYDGSVLDMREWNRHDFEDFTRYNKQFP